MNRKTMGQYFDFWNNMWAFFKRYPTGITDDNVWQAIPEANELSRTYCNIVNRSGIIEAVIRQLLEIGERERDSLPDDGEARIERVFKTINMYNGLSTDTISAFMTWLGWLSDLYPDQADNIVDGLAKTLSNFGMHFSNEELEAYIEAGWMIQGR